MRLRISMLALAALTLPGSALAGSTQPAFVPEDSVIVHRQGWLNGSTSFTVRYNDPVSGRPRFRTRVGAIKYRNLGGTGEGELIPLGSVGTFSIDLRDPLIPIRPCGQTEPINQYAVAPSIAPNGVPLSQEKDTLLRRLFSFSDVVNPQANVPPPPGFTRKQATMAFSLAVWEIVYERPGRETNVRRGAFRAFAFTKRQRKAAALADDYLEAIQNPNAREANVLALVPLDAAGQSLQGRYQDLIIAAVPEPGTWVMLASLGAIGAVALARRRRKQAAAR